MSEIFSTSDLWLSAVILSETDAELVDFQVSRNGRMNVSFSFRGENLTQLAHEYCEEKAYANVARLRNKINFLRDIIFTSKKKH